MFFTSKQAGAMSQNLQMLISDYRTLIFFRAWSNLYLPWKRRRQHIWDSNKDNLLMSSFDYNHLRLLFTCITLNASSNTYFVNSTGNVNDLPNMGMTLVVCGKGSKLSAYDKYGVVG